MDPAPPGKSNKPAQNHPWRRRVIAAATGRLKPRKKPLAPRVKPGDNKDV